MNQPTQSLTEARLVLDRGRPALDPQDPDFDRYYVPREYEGLEAIGMEAQAAVAHGRPFRWFLTGARGNGKSTEVNRIVRSSPFVQHFLPVVCDVRERLDVNDLEFSDLLLGTASSVVSLAESQNVAASKTWQRRMAEFCTAVDPWLMGNANGNGARDFRGFFLRATAEVRTGGLVRPILREKLRASMAEFIGLVDELTAAIEKKTRKQVLVVLDSLDHVDPGILLETLVNHWTNLTAPRASLLLVVPLSLYVERQFIDFAQGHCTVVPSLRVISQPGTRKLDGNGFRFFRDTLSRLVDLKLFSEPSLKELFRLSGGVVRDMIGFAGDSCGQAALARAHRVGDQHVRRVRDDLKAYFRKILTDDDYAVLHRVRDEPRPLNIAGLPRLLNLQAILLESNGDEWFRPSFAVESLLEDDSSIRRRETPSRSPASAPFVIERIRLENVRCFERLELRFGRDGHVALRNLIVGDNAAGKSTLLRCVALGLCHERDALSLLAKLPGRFVRQGAATAEIELTLWNPESRSRFVVTTTILADRSPSQSFEIVRKKVKSEGEGKGFRWEDVFACGYSANRASRTPRSHESYAMAEAVRTLFEAEAPLMNPEVVLLRETPLVRKRLEAKLLQVMMLDDPQNRILTDASGLSVAGPWGTLPLESLSDGYRSTTHWIADFVGWAIMAGRFGESREIGGILLIDELEQHLHPRWQRYLLSRLSRQFPETQIIATTHTPLLASGLADVPDATLIRLHRADGNAVVARMVDPRSLRGQRADQVLTSEAFGLWTSRSPCSVDDLERFQELDARKRTADEEQEWSRLRTQVDRSLTLGETPYQREVERAVADVLEQRLRQPPSAAMSLEIKRQLHDLFRGTATNDSH